MASDSRGLTQLKKFAAEIPDERETLALLQQLEQHDSARGSDRLAALLAAAFVENALRVALLSRFRPDEKGKGHMELFEGDNAPLRDFAAKISVGYVLRLFGQETLSDLQCIKGVRNVFAHSLMTMDFTTPQIVEVCSHLQSHRRLTLAGGGGTDSAKEKYIRCASYITGGLKRIALLTTPEIRLHAHYIIPAKTQLR